MLNILPPHSTSQVAQMSLITFLDWVIKCSLSEGLLCLTCWLWLLPLASEAACDSRETPLADWGNCCMTSPSWVIMLHKEKASKANEMLWVASQIYWESLLCQRSVERKHFVGFSVSLSSPYLLLSFIFIASVLFPPLLLLFHLFFTPFCPSLSCTHT